MGSGVLYGRKEIEERRGGNQRGYLWMMTIEKQTSTYDYEWKKWLLSREKTKEFKN